MQVTHQNEFVTHAVIGGKQTIDFGISSSAEFFNILSSTLYKDQILAVVREVLCNAWDAHIEAGCTSKPVEITLTSEKFTIKDFGLGIHHDDMGPIYGTYGNSTKKNDGNQTGGFGLGCKSPFAYTDHFEVISCHAGVKTIYNLSKSSAQAHGKPGIIPIASFATEETGLQVSIRIKNSQDHSRFKELIARIVKNGDMNMTLNGKVLEVLGFDTTKGNYLITTKNVLDTSSKIVIRYGNVIYPVDESASFNGQYIAILQHLKRLSSYSNCTLILQAPAHSISVTPSRESLSMQEHTINTLRGLFNDFLNVVNTTFIKECVTYASEVINQAVTDNRIGDLLSRKPVLPFKSTLTASSDITTATAMAKYYLHNQYPSDLAFRKQDIKQRLTLLNQKGVLERGCVQTFLRELVTVKKSYKEVGYHQEKTTWLQRMVIAPLMVKLTKAGLDHDRLYVCDAYDSHNPYSYHQTTQPPLVKACKASPTHLIASLPYLRNIVVLASAKSTVVERAQYHKTFRELGSTNGFLFYHTGLKAGDKKAALDFFNSTGMRVVDLTHAQTWEAPVVKADPVQRKPRKVGIPALSCLIQGTGIYTENFYKEDATRIENPEFILKLSFRACESKCVIDVFDIKASEIIVNKFGSKGGLVSTSAAETKWFDKGVKTFKAFIDEQVCTYIQNSPSIKEYWSFNMDLVRSKLPTSNRSLIHTIYTSKELMTEFSLINNLSDEDKEYLYLWDQILRKHATYARSDQVKNTIAYLESIPLDPANTVLINKISGNPFIGLFDSYAFNTLVTDKNTQPNIVKKAFEILIDTING